MNLRGAQSVLVMVAVVVPGLVSTMGVLALETNATISVAEDGAVCKAVTAVEVFPRTADNVLRATLTGAFHIFNAMLAEEGFEVEGLHATKGEWRHHFSQYLAKNPRAWLQGV